MPLYVRTLVGLATEAPMGTGRRTRGGKYLAPYMSSASSEGSVSSMSSSSRGRGEGEGEGRGVRGVEGCERV